MELVRSFIGQMTCLPAYIRVIMCNHPTGRNTTEKGHWRGIVALLTNLIINHTDIINSILKTGKWVQKSKVSCLMCKQKLINENTWIEFRPVQLQSPNPSLSDSPCYPTPCTESFNVVLCVIFGLLMYLGEEKPFFSDLDSCTRHRHDSVPALESEPLHLTLYSCLVSLSKVRGKGCQIFQSRTDSSWCMHKNTV